LQCLAELLAVLDELLAVFCFQCRPMSEKVVVYFVPWALSTPLSILRVEHKEGGVWAQRTHLFLEEAFGGPLVKILGILDLWEP